MSIVEVGEFPPVEDSLVLRLAHVHDGTQTLVVVRRYQAIEVAKLYHWTNLLVLGDSLLAESLLLIGHVLRLNLHTQATAHRHVNAILQGCGAEDGMIRNGGDMTCHGNGWEEVAGAILHVDALEGIGVVAHPELIETTETTPVGTTSTAGTALDDNILVLGTDAIHHLGKTCMISNIHVTLVCHREILATMVHDRHVGIPLDISNLRILGEQVINHAEHEILHLRIGEVEHELRATTTQDGITLRSLEDPVGMLLVEFAHTVGHLWLYPDTKLHAILLGITEQALDTIRQLVGIYHPVAQGAVVGLARIFLAKPSIVHHEEFSTHRVDVSHHLVHTLLVDVEIDALPGVEEDVTLLVAMSQDVLASPLVEVAARTAQSLGRVSECQGWGLESLALLQVIL